MGIFTGIAAVATLITTILTVAAVILGLVFVALAVQFFVEKRPVRLAVHESIPTFYLRGHAFAHRSAFSH